MNFGDLKISGETLEALAAMGVTEPTAIQAEATPYLLEGRDVIGQARTGSGKTLAFSIPLVEKCDPDLSAVQAMVLVPTRELAFQVGSVIEDLSKKHRLRCAFLYGGRDVSDQQTLLASGPQVVIGTPGRLLDLLFRGNLRLNTLRFLVIDEADEMFDEGFGPDVDQLLDCILQKPQVALFSATVPQWVRDIMARRLPDAVVVRVDSEAPVESVEHRVIEVPEGRKTDALEDLLRAEGTAVVFCRTKDGVERLAAQLASHGFEVASLRGNMTQPERERVMRAFRKGHPETLVATNVAARGLDVAHISRVINYDLPDSPELLTHRLGRTGRMGRSGEAMTLVSPRDRKRWLSIQASLPLTVLREPWKPLGVREANQTAPRQRAGAVAGGSPSGHSIRREGVSGSRARGPRRRDASAKAAVPSPETPSLERGGRNRAPCDGCGTMVEVTWKPTPSRPAYCRDCRSLLSVAV